MNIITVVNGEHKYIFFYDDIYAGELALHVVDMVRRGVFSKKIGIVVLDQIEQMLYGG